MNPFCYIDGALIVDSLETQVVEGKPPGVFFKVKCSGLPYPIFAYGILANEIYAYTTAASEFDLVRFEVSVKANLLYFPDSNVLRLAATEITYHISSKHRLRANEILTSMPA